MRKLLLSAALLCPGFALGSITYSYAAGPITFSITTPTYLQPGAMFGEGDFASCTGVPLNGTCERAVFGQVTLPNNVDQVNLTFNYRTGLGDLAARQYEWVNASLNTPGVYTRMGLINDGPATLVITDTSEVPEPRTLGLLALSALGFAMPGAWKASRSRLRLWRSAAVYRACECPICKKLRAQCVQSAEPLICFQNSRA